MRALAVLGPNFPQNLITNPVETIDICGVPVQCAIIELTDPEFDQSSAKHRHHVLVRTTAFSVNFRDRGRVVRTAVTGSPRGTGTTSETGRPTFSLVGSEFVGQVVAVGEGVTRFRPGDRVIPDGAYPILPERTDVRSGLPTNHASREMAIFHEAKLIQVPSEIPDEVAAGFTIGGQTTYSIVRRLNLQKGERVLVTSARSNTSLFAIGALRKYPVDVFAATTSSRNHDDLRSLGVREVFQVGREADGFVKCEKIRSFYAENGGFHCVIDPMNDANLAQVIFGMADFGRYVSCGLVNQAEGIISNPVSKPIASMEEIMAHAIFHNISLIGNCLGLRTDLEAALADCAAGRLHVPIDSVFRGTDAGGFLHRSFSDDTRFGKVIFQYEES
jgi:NADPH:quinone reductase-like Zn-dependent oxidoreductase